MQLKKVKLIPPTLYQEKLVNHFAKECYITNADMYAKRGQHDKSKIISDIYLGKMGEYAVFNFTISMGKKISPPDIMIYERKLKSFDADLVSVDNNIHVKTQIIATKNADIYWTFQPKDPITHSPTDNDFVALTIVNHETIEYHAYFLKAKDLLDIYKNDMYGNNDRKYIFESSLLS